MFSKQADNRASKTTNKKRNKTVTNNNTTGGGGTPTGKKNNKSARNKTKQQQTKPDLIEDIKDKNVDLVVLRTTDDNKKNGSVKRYSDSFVLADDDRTKKIEPPKLARAASGFIFSEEEKLERRGRRFSDLFRYGALKSYNSCDNLKMLPTTMEGKISDEMDGVVLRATKKPEAVFKEPEKKRESAPSLTNTNNSYLKRVKSKIYKNKNEGVGNTLPTMPDISETTTKTNKKAKNKKNAEIKQSSQDNPQPEVRRTFDFRLIRQTSNLERIRPRSFAPKKCPSNTGIAELTPQDSAAVQEKPILVKSKSSSAISLNLLRTRRNKILEQVKSRNCKVVENEFDFIPFGNSLRSSQRLYGSQTLNTLNNNVGDVAKPTMNGEDKGETKPGHPVTRTGSDRRPDAVREESSKGSQDSQDNVHDKHEDDTSHTESSISLPAATSNKRRTSSNINRSESVREQSEKEKRKQRRNISDPLHNTSNDHKDLELDSQGIAANSGSSSNSSLSSNSRLSESPSNNSGDANLGGGGGHPTGSDWDSDMEVETDPPDWQTSVPPDDLASLPAHEKKRQDVINELFHTERSHVRNLKVLDIVFMKPLASKQCLKPEELSLVFPNLNELLDIHVRFNNSMKIKRKENPIVKDVGDILVNMFDGAVGECFQNAAAAFCERQQLALEFIKEKRKKDSRFETILSDCEKSNLCRRLPLQGIIPTQMQRLSKYPLLLERLIAIVEKNLELDAEFWQTELNKLRQAHDRSKEILKHVNEAAKLACNRARLEEIQRHLDTSNFPENRNIDLTEHKFIYEGDMLLKRQNKGPVQVRALLLEEMLVLLQREGEKYFLKYFQIGVPGQPLSPIIKTNTLLFRENAISSSSLYIVNMSSQKSQMYDLQCRDYAERKVWFKHLSDATEAYQIKEGKPKQSDHNNETEEETVQELPPTSSREATATERAEAVGGVISGAETQSHAEGGGEPVTEEANGGGDVSSLEDDKEKRLSQTDGDGSCSSNALSAEVIGGGQQPKVAADDWPLIQPSEVQVAVPPVLTAEPRLTPLEQLRRKDEEVRQALADKEILVADLLSIPREDFQHIADMASEDMCSDISSERDSSEYVLAPLYQVNQLLEAVNDALNISEVDPILATGGKHPSCASNEALISNKSEHVPSVPAHKIRDIVTTLSTQLTTLLGVVKQRDSERERLRKEVHRLREQCHERNSLHSHMEDNTSALDSIQSGDLESIEESPTENES